MHRRNNRWLGLLLFFATVCANGASLSIERQGDLSRLNVSAPGGYVEIEAVGELGGFWEFMAGMTPPFQAWLDAESGLRPQRFYRATSAAEAPFDYGVDFGLIDHQGRSRWLYYHLNDPLYRAVVLISTRNGCSRVGLMIPTIKALTNRFPNVMFWLVDSDPADNRSNILAEAVSLGISNGPPILHDISGEVGRVYGSARTTPYAVAMDTSSFQVFYRGTIDDRLGSNTVSTTQYYLSNALVNFLGGNSIPLIRTKANGCSDLLPPPPIPTISYSTEIAPLLQAKCVQCHSPGNIAPWAMTNYAIVSNNAGGIKMEVLVGRMPPWHADPYYQVFTNDSSLTPQQMKRLIQWIDSGAPRGSGPDPLETAPTPTNYPHAWPVELGPPTQIVSIPLQNIPATGDVDYRYITVNSPFASDVWLRAAVVLPGNLRVVHHVLVYTGGSSQLMGLDGFFAGYVPGNQGGAFPPGTGKLLRAGEQLTFQMHYITTGQPDTDQTQLGFYVMPAAPTYALQTKSAFNAQFSLGGIGIPPGNRDFEITAPYPVPLLGSSTLTTNILIFEMSPHMHYRGSRFKYEAVYADGTREVLLSVPHYLFDWQRVYRLTTPKRLPRGSRIVCTGAWDNSAQNRHNPDPNDTVFWGDQTYEEMFIGYFSYAEVP
jgi:hypothetical protein